MSILIKGMEMPKEGTVIAIYKLNGQFYATMHGTELCPIVLVPPHGDLIDAEEQMRLMRACEYDTYDDYNRAYDMLDNAPTIIPAERRTDE